MAGLSGFRLPVREMFGVRTYKSSIVYWLTKEEHKSPLLSQTKEAQMCILDTHNSQPMMSSSARALFELVMIYARGSIKLKVFLTCLHLGIGLA